MPAFPNGTTCCRLIQGSDNTGEICPKAFVDDRHMSRQSKSITVTSKLRAEVISLLVAELGYERELARSLVIRHEGLMLKAVGEHQPVGPIALAIHLAHQRQCAGAA